jgi:hypothetical protein
VDQVVDTHELPLERLEADICEGAAHLVAGMARWLSKVAEFDRRKGYERWECRSSAFWLNWHCGISIRTAQEQVRVARALEELSAVAEAFGRGELSYSKVRAITRVATPATEAQLLEWAPQATAAQLERIAAGQRKVRRTEADEVHKARHVSALYDDDGALVGTFRLDPDEGAAFLAALTLGKDLLRAERSAERRSEKRSAEVMCGLTNPADRTRFARMGFEVVVTGDKEPANRLFTILAALETIQDLSLRREDKRAFVISALGSVAGSGLLELVHIVIKVLGGLFPDTTFEIRDAPEDSAS